MNDEYLDVEATKRVTNRALASAGLALVGGCAAAVVPLSNVVMFPFLAIAIVVGVSAVRTLNHPDAKVVGAARHVGIVVAVLGVLAACFGIVARVLVVVGH